MAIFMISWWKMSIKSDKIKTFKKDSLNLMLITFLHVIIQATSIDYFEIIPLFCSHPLFCNYPAVLKSSCWFDAVDVIVWADFKIIKKWLGWYIPNQMKWDFCLYILTRSCTFHWTSPNSKQRYPVLCAFPSLGSPMSHKGFHPGLVRG